MNPKKLVVDKIMRNGGWVNTHAHLDRAFSLTDDTFKYTNSYLKDKWSLVDDMKSNSSVDDVFRRMAKATELMIAQGAQAIGSFIDVDEVIEDRSIKAAQKLKDEYGKDIEIRFANQVLKGVIDPKARYWFDMSVDFVDIIGGLPLKDSPNEEKHLDILMQTAKDNNKLVHVHVDQFNSSDEKETEQLARKTIEHGMQGKVTAIHSISVAAHPRTYREQVYKLIKEADMNVVSCPTAWIDHDRTEKLTVSHNSMTPVDEMVPAGITLAFGTDNICDIYKPFSDGDLWTEMRVMLEACHYYNVDELVNIATINGLKVLGIKK